MSDTISRTSFCAASSSARVGERPDAAAETVAQKTRMKRHRRFTASVSHLAFDRRHEAVQPRLDLTHGIPRDAEFLRNVADGAPLERVGAVDGLRLRRDSRLREDVLHGGTTPRDEAFGRMLEAWLAVAAEGLLEDLPPVGFLDADLDLNPDMFAGYVKAMKDTGADIVIGSKMHKDSKIEYPFLRKVMSYGYYYFMKLLFGLKVKDTQTGIKLFRTTKAVPVLKAMRTSRFSFDIELLAISAKLNYKILEMPVVVNFSRNKANRSRIRIRSIFEMIRDSIRIKVYLSKMK